MEGKEVIQETVLHWERMLVFAKKQDPDEWADKGLMLEEIGEDWFGQSCPLCLEAERERKIDIQYKKAFNLQITKLEIWDCEYCLLAKVFGRCLKGNANNFWSFVERSKTWGEWAINAEKFILQIKSLKEVK